MSNKEIEKGSYPNGYFIMKEINSGMNGHHNTYDAEWISDEKFAEYKFNNFDRLSDWSLKSNRKIFIIEAGKAIVKIIPNVTISF